MTPDGISTFMRALIETTVCDMESASYEIKFDLFMGGFGPLYHVEHISPMIDLDAL